MTDYDRMDVADYLQDLDASMAADAQRQQQLRSLVSAALQTDGGHHKQWYLCQIATLLGISTGSVEPGIAP